MVESRLLVACNLLLSLFLSYDYKHIQISSIFSRTSKICLLAGSNPLIRGKGRLRSLHTLLPTVQFVQAPLWLCKVHLTSLLLAWEACFSEGCLGSTRWWALWLGKPGFESQVVLLPASHLFSLSLSFSSVRWG